MKVAVVGLGYVGLPVALQSRKKGLEVIGVDKNQDIIKLLKQKRSPIQDGQLIKDVVKYPFEVSTDLSDGEGSDIFVVCVPTPVKHDLQPNLEPLKGAVKEIAGVLKPGQLVIIESTINPGVCDEVVLPILESETGLKCGSDFYLAHCPERINPGDPKWTVQNIPRVVGATSQKGLEMAMQFYTTIIDADIRPMGNIKEAEAVKVVENSFRDINIAFVNELAMSFTKLGINVVNVINGAATKPFAFMPHYPGAGVGGHCIPVDPYYLIEYARKKNFNHEFLMLARDINSHMPEFAVEQLIDGLNEVKLALNGSRIAVLGVSYKPDVDDDRESPSYVIQESLKAKGAQLSVFDPHVIKKSSVKTLDEALDGQDALVIATAHAEFKAIDPAKVKKLGIKVVLDGRNCLDRDAWVKAGLIYRGIGVN